MPHFRYAALPCFAVTLFFANASSAEVVVLHAAGRKRTHIV